MTLVDIYADEGITGTSVNKRTDFKRLIKDCQNRNKEFTLLAHDLPGIEGQEDKYPFKAVGHNPLFAGPGRDYFWLDLFGF